MISNRSIQFKAVFLLVVFSLNTLVGFACSVGVDMGFNSTHHKDEAVKPKIHTHKDGKKQQHSPKEITEKKDGCCKENAIKLQIADKNLNHSQTVINSPVIYLPCTIYQLQVYNTEKGKAQKYIACQFHPPPRDIRIAISSFQI